MIPPMNDLTPSSPAASRIGPLTQLLRQTHPDFHVELDHTTAFELLIATILSAQSTDVRVNQVTPTLFAEFPTPTALAAAPRERVEEIIHPVGFYRQKAKFIQETARLLVERHNGEVPGNLDALTQLPGAARKTANVVLGNWFGIKSGVVVDTHVKRLSNRLGLTTHADPIKIEQDLIALVPQDDWVDISHLLIFHGRRVCFARKPNCPACTISHLCPSAGVA